MLLKGNFLLFKFSGSRFSIKIIAHSTTHRAKKRRFSLKIKKQTTHKKQIKERIKQNKMSAFPTSNTFCGVKKLLKPSSKWKKKQCINLPTI